MRKRWAEWWAEIAPYVALDLALLAACVYFTRPKPPVATFTAAFDEARGKSEITENT